MCRNVFQKMVVPAMMVAFSISSVVSAKSLKAPPGMFKDLNDEILGDAVIINGKQLFIDDYIIDQINGAEKVLNQPVKHPKNPLMTFTERLNGYGSVLYDEDEKTYKMWYEIYYPKLKKGALCYATSPDGIVWNRPIINEQKQNNTLSIPKAKGFLGGAGVFKDPVARDPDRRYKMLYVAKPDGTSKSLSTDAAYSPDGIRWSGELENPIVPFSDTQICPYWDIQRGRYVAYLRFGPPNTRIITRIESEDFVHWSPKVTVIPRSKMDGPFSTCFYGMRIMPYAGIYIGLITAYHGETIQPIPKEKEAWMDKENVQLAFSRNGLTWRRVGKHGAVPHDELSKDRDWKTFVKRAVFIPNGEHKKAWDWGQIYHGDTHKGAIGLDTVSVDGFVSIDAKDKGTMKTKPFVFIGDTLEVNANAAGGSIRVEVLDPEGKVIEGFAKKDCTAITSDSVRHVLKWKGKGDCHLIQARPIKLRFYLKKAKLYSFTPRIRHKHYIQSYD